MANIEVHTDPIVAAIYKAYEDREEEKRGYLGASSLGNECKRALWYGFRWATLKKFDGRMLRLFQTGHLEEPRMVADLRAIGATVWDVDPATGKQFKAVSFAGHMKGHCDGIAQNIPTGGKKPHLTEYKTHSAKSFALLKKDGLKKSKPVHYAQMIWYMGKMNLERGLYLAKNKDTDELYSDRIEFDPIEFAKLEAKAESIIFADQPPSKLSTDPSFYLCKLCDHHGVCHGHQVPAVGCRTCTRSTPERDGDARWSCQLAGPESAIPPEYQAIGCHEHLHLPFLLTYAAPVDAGDGWIEYKRTDNGKVFVVLAEGHTHPNPVFPIYSSQEIAAAKDHRAICDEGVEAIRKQYDAKVVG